MSKFGKHKDMKSFKAKEIKKSLTHRARLRKNYFKMMEKDGIQIDKDEQERPEPKEKLGHSDKIRIAKERTKASREEKLKQIQEKKRMIEKSQEKRERAKKQLTQRTRSGQPLMGPRINNLLDKIKNEMK